MPVCRANVMKKNILRYFLRPFSNAKILLLLSMAQEQNLYPRALGETVLTDSLVLLEVRNRFLRTSDKEKAQLKRCQDR